MIKHLLNQFKGRLILATLFSSLSSLLSITLVAQANQWVNFDGDGQSQTIMYTYAGTVIGLFFIGFASQRMLSKLGIELVYQLRSFMLKRVLNADYENLEHIGGHRVYAMVTTDVAAIAGSLAILPIFAVNFASIVFILCYLAWQAPALFGVLFVSLTVGLSLSVLIMRQGSSYFKKLREDQDSLFKAFKTMVEGNKELNINQHRRDFFYRHQALPSVDKIKQTSSKAEFFWVLNQNWSGAMIFAVLGLLIYIAQAKLQLDKSVLSGFVLFLIYLVGPITFIMNTFQTLSRGRVSYQKLQTLKMLNEPEAKAANAAEVAVEQKSWKVLKSNAVCYRYKSGDDFEFSIGPVELQINRGEIFFIRGGNGSGKSTFAKVLVGLYNPHEGNMSLDNTPITSENLQWYRNHFATVFSDFYLFEHVLDSKGELVVADKVKDQLKTLKLDDKVTIKDGKLSTTQLSQGQKKRLAMLLAYAEDAEIYVFDEWAADQDPTFRNYFYTELLPELKRKGKTVVAITHDDKYFHLADRLCTFDMGVAEVE